MIERKVMIREMLGRMSMALYLYSTLPNGEIEVEYQDAEKGIGERKRFKPGEAISPTLVLTQEDLQMLADELQRLNVRPKEASKTEGLLEAQSVHLADMRRLVFDEKIEILGNGPST